MISARDRGPLPLIGLALISAVIFFWQVGSLWPIAPGDHLSSATELRAIALPILADNNIDVSDWDYASRLRVDDPSLRYLEKSVGRQASEDYINQGLPLYYHRLTFKKPGDPHSVTCIIDGHQRLLGFEQKWQRDDHADDRESAQVIPDAFSAIENILNLDPTRCTQIEVRTSNLPNRLEYSLTYSYLHQESPRIEEEIHIIFSGNRLSKIWRSFLPPAAFIRAQRRDAAPGELLESLGFAGLGLISAAALVILLLTLNRSGDCKSNKPAMKIVPALIVMAVLAVMLLINSALQYTVLFERWDPLWPKSIAFIRQLLFDLINNAMTLMPLVAFIIVGSHLASKNARCDSFWLACRGRWTMPTVRHASFNGFAIGLCCGALLLLCAWFFQSTFGGYNELQPRGFFFYTINSSASILTCLCFFGYIAMMEEFAYRIFAGAWIDQLWKKRTLSIAIPAIIYGLCHANFAFLPPAEPWWARCLCLTAIGAVWGWAFFRYDALTVILSHLAADLFIFNWPLIASGNTSAIFWAILSVSLPLWPGIVGSLLSVRTHQKT